MLTKSIIDSLKEIDMSNLPKRFEELYLNNEGGGHFSMRYEIALPYRTKYKYCEEDTDLRHYHLSFKIDIHAYNGSYEMVFNNCGKYDATTPDIQEMVVTIFSDRLYKPILPDNLEPHSKEWRKRVTMLENSVKRSLYNREKKFKRRLVKELKMLKKSIPDFK